MQTHQPTPILIEHRDSPAIEIQPTIGLPTELGATALDSLGIT